jgi:phenylpropionate dioxygenase-like ring-hydroxylating dioxygenase large terminal subunit
MKNAQSTRRTSNSRKVIGTKPNSVLAHYWHLVAWSRDLADKPLAVKLLDHPVVVWRSESGVAAFHDLCIHRGTPLSLGWTENGRIVCA